MDKRAMLEQTGVPLVFDHMGYFDVAQGIHERSFRSFVDFVASTPSWVKLVPTRVTKQRWSNCDDVRPFHDAILQAVPGHSLWGSDWPYIAMDGDLPDICSQIDLFDRWTPDAEVRRAIFVDNPKRLYGNA